MHDLVVVSDLHLGRGRNPETGRFHALETFFHDDDFQAFCAYLCQDAAARGRGFKLILGGDTLDLLRIDRPGPGEPGDAETGPAQVVRAILSGHPGFVAGLAQVVGAGHEVVFLPGNHDLALQRDDVRQAVRDAIAGGLPPASDGLARLRFEPWFFHEPGRIWIEHGSQYDPEGAFRWLLRGGEGRDDERDLPLGNFFQRHLYNALGPITFIVPSSEANTSYFRWLALHRPRDLARVALRHLPFALRLIRRLARHASPPTALAETHETELSRLAETSGLGARLRAIDELKQSDDLARTVTRLGRRAVRTLLGGFLLVLLGVGVWSAGHLGIAALRLGIHWKAALSLALSFAMLTLGLAGLLYSLLRAPRAAARTLPRAAQGIAELAGVPLVVFGHTHAEHVARLERGWYFNTGTWIAVFLGDELAPRAPVQLTYLRVGDEGGELLHFCPASRRPRPVVLLDPR